MASMTSPPLKNVLKSSHMGRWKYNYLFPLVEFSSLERGMEGETHLHLRLTGNRPAPEGRYMEVLLNHLGPDDPHVSLRVKIDLDLAGGVVGEEDGVKHCCDEAVLSAT